MFKKLSSFFFEDVEEEELEEEEEEQEVRVEPSRKSLPKDNKVINSYKSSTIEDKTSFFEEKKNIFFDEKETIKVEPKTKKEPMEFYEVAQKPKTFIDIDEEVEKIKQKVDEKQNYRRPEKAVVKKEEKPAYEFTAVISPIFGLKEGNNDITYNQPVKSHTEIEDDSVLGTIISPIYGKVNQINSNIEEDIVTNDERVVSELPPKYDLDDLLTYEKKEEVVKESVHQFSMFENDEDDDLQLEEFFKK